MRRPFVPTLLLLGMAALATPACDKASPTTPTTPSNLVTITETFSGRVTLNGAVIFPFTVGAAGGVSATAVSLEPNVAGTTAIDLSLGVWNGTACAIFIENNSTFTGSSIVGNVAGSGTLCTRVADPNGELSEPITFILSIVHF